MSHIRLALKLITEYCFHKPASHKTNNINIVQLPQGVVGERPIARLLVGIYTRVELGTSGRPIQ